MWLSTAEGGDKVALHFTWQPRQPEVEAILPTIEAVLSQFNARPHWGKLFKGGTWLQTRYPKLKDFQDLARDLDPTGKFHNPYLTKNVLT